LHISFVNLSSPYDGGMEWVQDMAERWVRIMSASGDGSTQLDEAVRRLSPVGSSLSHKGGRIGRRKTRAAAEDEASAVTALCRQLIAGVLVSDLVIDRLSVLEGRSREQVLERMLASGLPQLPDKQLQVLQTELSYSGAEWRDPQVPTYAGLGSRIEQLVRIAEQQAATLVQEARQEAAAIKSSAGTQQPCPRCGARQSA
jgi:hypothetical protein